MRSARVLIVLTFAATAYRAVSGQSPQQQGIVAAGHLSLTTNSAAAKAEFWTGLEDWQSGAYSSAERHFRRALALDERFALARVFATGEYVVTEQQLLDRERGVADAARQSTEEGIFALFWREKALGHGAKKVALLQAAMQLMPNEPGIAVEYIWASCCTDPKSLLDSARALRARFPNYAPLGFPIVGLSMMTGDTAGALREAEAYARSAPRTPASFSTYGDILRQLGRFEEAEVQYRKGMSLLPMHADYGNDAASALVEMYEVRGRNADARAVASEALARVSNASDSAMYMTEIAGTYFATGDSRQGMQLLEKAREKSPTMGNANGPERLDAILAAANGAFGDGRLVSVYFGRIHAVDALDSAVVLMLGARAYGYAGQLDSALAYSDRLANQTSVGWSGPWSHRMRGVAFANAKQCARAVPELAQAADTLSVEVLAARADCALQLGHRSEALGLRDRALASQDFSLFTIPLIKARMRLAEMK